MSSTSDLEIVDGVTFELRPHSRTPTTPGWVCLRKNRQSTDRYLDLAAEFQGGRMIEVGVDQGGSTSFFTKLMRPAAFAAIEISAKPVATVTDFLLEHDPDQRTSIHWGVDQADREAVPAIVDEVFGDEPLDLVVDDASHLREPSTATFEMLFPRLRAGGAYIIEDWSWNHLEERGMVRLLEADTDGSVRAKLEEAALSPPPFAQPMSLLVSQLVIAAGRHPEWISEVQVADDFCLLRRGSGDIEADTPLADYLGTLGSQMFGHLPG